MNAGSCIAGLKIQITSSGLLADGSISAFDVGPISFADAEVNIEMTKEKQSVAIAGGATLYDPIDFYADPDGAHDIWASGHLGIGLSQQSLHVNASIDGCIVLGGKVPAGPGCTDAPTRSCSSA